MSLPWSWPDKIMRPEAGGNDVGAPAEPWERAMTQTPESSGMTFGCGKCGAKLAFDASSQGMRCPFCGHTQTVTAAAGAPAAPSIREIPIEQGLQLAQRGLGAPATTLGCKDCGATVNVGQGQQTARCSFCGSHQVLQQPEDPNIIRPESLIPFKVDRARGIEQFKSWVKGLWFRPSNLKHMASVEQVDGVYVPFWTFDSTVTSMWTAERGHHYQETETYSTEENGQTVTKQREVTRTRWEPAAGSRTDAYDDVIVCASRGLPESLVDRFSTFQTGQLVPYQPEYLSGWRAESYALDLLPAWAKGQQKIAAAQQSRCASDVGGDTHRALSVNNQFAAVTFKHVLLPVWIAAYRYQGKPFRFLINGQTGEVVGEAPWSIVKIVLFVVAVLALLVGIAAAVATLSGRGPTGAPTTAVPTQAPTSAVPRPPQPVQRVPAPVQPSPVRNRK
jgi:DNA-directed RNA polymerase subunit RPC12/RpoP